MNQYKLLFTIKAFTANYNQLWITAVDVPTTTDRLHDIATFSHFKVFSEDKSFS